MASIDPIQYGGFWVELNQLFRTTDVRIYEPEPVQIDNMRLIIQYFRGLDWTDNAIAGMLGNIMVESSVNPWLFEHRSLDWDDPAAILLDDGGMGLTQWTPCRKYYTWATDNFYDPKDGYIMCDRIIYEWLNNLQWSLNNYGHHTWNDFVHSEETPELLARVWCWAYERPANPDIEQRRQNARWVFDNLCTGRIKKKPAVLWYMETNSKKRKGGRTKCRRI